MLVLQSGGVLVNRASVSKAGLKLGEVLTFRRLTLKRRKAGRNRSRCGSQKLAGTVHGDMRRDEPVVTDVDLAHPLKIKVLRPSADPPLIRHRDGAGPLFRV